MKKSKKREKRNKAFLVFVLIIFLVSSIGGVVVYYNTDDTNTIRMRVGDQSYRLKFTTDTVGNGYYEVSSKDHEFTAFFPPQAISLDIDDSIENSLISSPYYYLSIDPESENLDMIDYIRLDLRQNMPENKFFLDSVTEQTPLYSLPVADCRNATSVPVVILKTTNTTTNITSAGNCLEIDFALHHATQVRDSLVYLSYGIRPGDDYAS